MSPLGDKIGQYLLSKKLGEGGMGAVFLGEHEFTGRQAAIKMISGGHFENEESIRRLHTG
jgi:serine/threonine-protein kinase